MCVWITYNFCFYDCMPMCKIFTHLAMNHLIYFSSSVSPCQATQQIINLYKMFMSVDATQVEINPFGETPDGRGMYVCVYACM